MKILSLNTGLFSIFGSVGPVLYSHIRVAHLPHNLSQVGADIICLQEVFSPDHITELTAECIETHPYIFYSKPQGDKFSSGLIVISKFPLFATEELELTTPWFEQMYLKRTALFAKTTNEEGENIGIITTHLTASNMFLIQESKGAHKTRKKQISEILDFSNSFFSDCEKVFFTGDFNCGPTIDSDNYQLPLSHNFFDTCTHISELEKPTWDSENILNKKGMFYKTSPSQRIDHIYFHSKKALAFQDKNIKSSLVFTDSNILIGDDKYPVSDHYGIMVEI